MRNKIFNPKVSIIIPVYNGSNYVHEAIESALAQTYENLEIIVVNDGSTDDGKTDAICKSYGNRIRYFAKENGGVATALNLAIKMMKGEYFSWLSHDDVYYPEKIQKSIEYISKLKNKSVVLFCDYETINEEGQLIERIRFNHEILKSKPEYGLLRGCINGITMLIPRKAFMECGDFDLKLRCTQDYDMWRRIMKKYPFVHAPIIATKTRIHAGQDSNKHPNVLTEGNPLWITMMEDVSRDRRIALEGTEYNFYKEMMKFLAGTPYDEAKLFAKQKTEEIVAGMKNKITNTKLSILLPITENSQISQFIGSLQKQTCNNWELIIMMGENASIPPRLMHMIETNKRIKVCRANEKKEMILKKVTGEYLLLLDDSSTFENSSFEILLEETSLTDKNVVLAKNGDFISVCSAISGNRIPQMILKRELLNRSNINIAEYCKPVSRSNWLIKISNEIGIAQLSAMYSSSKSARAEEAREKIVEELLQKESLLKDSDVGARKIFNVCGEIVNLSEKLVQLEADKNKNSYWDAKPKNPVLRIIYLFKHQGILLTVRKIIAKYSVKILHKK